MSSDDYATAVIAEGQRRGITARGIQIALATCLVESDMLMYANSKVPESLDMPHDAVGSDGFSVGLFQQQVRQGPNGWWWGDCATCMNPTASAGLFYDRLARLDYNGPNSPGSYAQAVQQSAFPDRYDERMGDAVDLYNRLAGGVNSAPSVATPRFTETAMWCNNSQSRNGRAVDLWLLHTQEGPGDAVSLRNFLAANQVSYHYTISQDNGAVTVIDVVDTDLASWSVLDANNESINLCFAGSFVSWSRQDWLDNAGNCIDVAAYLAVQDCRKYGIPTDVIRPPYNADPPGISDHRYVTQHLGIGSHVDVGENFPWDVFTEAVNKYAGTGADDMPLINGPSRSMYRTDDNDIGPGTEVEFQNNGMLHEERVESLAMLGVPWELGLVTRIANGDTSMPAADQPGAADRARVVLSKAPKAAVAKAQKAHAEAVSGEPKPGA